MKIKILSYKPFEGNTKILKGLFAIQVFDNTHTITIQGCRYCEKDSKKWITLPEKNTKDAMGKWTVEYPYVAFDKDKEVKKEILDSLIAFMDSNQETQSSEASLF